jgi:Polyketide cyclase / dehydrase and lipid transport
VQVDLAKTASGSSTNAFAIIANVTDWPRIIDMIKGVELLTGGPIRAGSRLREQRVGDDSTQSMEVANIEPPRRLRFIVEHRIIHYELDYLIDGIYGGECRISLIFRSTPRTQVDHVAHPFMTPFMAIRLRDELEQDLSDFAAAASVQDSLARSSQTPRF